MLGRGKGGGIKAGESNRLNKLVRKASSVVGLELDSLEVVVESRMRDKFHTRARVRACVINGPVFFLFLFVYIAFLELSHFIIHNLHLILT